MAFRALAGQSERCRRISPLPPDEQATPSALVYSYVCVLSISRSLCASYSFPPSFPLIFFALRISLSLSLSLSLTHSFPLQYIYPKAPLLNMLMPEKCTAIFYFLIRSPTITGVYMRDVAHLAFTLAGLAFFALSIICLDNFQCYWSRCTSHLDIQYMFRCVCGASGKKRKGDIGFKSVRMLGAPNRIFIYIAEEERKREKEKTWSWVTDVLLFIHLQADAVSDTST